MNSQASSSAAPSSQVQADQTPAVEHKQSGASGFAAALAKLEKDGAGEKPVGSAGGESADGDDKSGEPRKSVKATPEDLGALAQALGIKVEDLYKVKVPATGGRDAMTIGQIKDKFAE